MEYVSYDQEIYNKVSNSTNDKSITMAGLGGAAGAVVSHALLKNVKEIKEFIIGTENAEECIKGLEGYVSGLTPIAFVARKCIKYCKTNPETYKAKCLKCLNNYYALMFTGGTAAGITGGAIGGQFLRY